MSVLVRRWPDGWYVVVHHRGRRVTRKCASREKAEQAADIIRAQLLLQGDQALASFAKKRRERFEDTRFEPFANRWVKEIKASDRALSTVQRYRGIVTQHLIPEFGHMQLSLIDYRTIKEFCGRKQKTFSRDSVRLMVATLRLIMKEAFREGIIPSNPAQELGKHYGKRKHAEIEAFTSDELTAILEATRHRYPEYYEFVLLSARTGMRFGEARALQWRDIDFRNRRIFLARSWPSQRAVRALKTKTSRRTIDMTPQLVEALRRLRARRKAEALRAGEEVSPWLFPNEERAFDHHRVCRTAWLKICELAEVRPRKWHTLRHTYATLLLLGGTNLVYVSKQLGHSSVKTTLDVYTHWIEQAGDVRAVDVLDEGAQQ